MNGDNTGAGFPGAFGALSGMSSDSSVHNNSNNDLGATTGAGAAMYAAPNGSAGQPASVGSDEPASKRVKLEGSVTQPSAAVLQAASIAANRAMAPAMATAAPAAAGSRMTTQQFLQALPTAFALNNPAVMMMIQQQQQQHQQQQQQFVQRQQQMQLQNALQASAPMFVNQSSAVQHAQQLSASMQAHAMMMARMNAMAATHPRVNNTQGPITAQSTFGSPLGFSIVPAASQSTTNTTAGTAKPEVLASAPPAPAPVEPVCWVCKEKGDVVTCYAG
ncbi:hypothetical protein ATCC90586_002395 [Pythium insidiosum]|nr:hypothetical protein ATCC90586_002395 [Pythium insidiosum]